MRILLLLLGFFICFNSVAEEQKAPSVSPFVYKKLTPVVGWVKVEFIITEQGTVKDPVVVASQPADIFDRAALNAIRKWKFTPKVIDGVAFEQRAVQILKFKLSK